MAWDLYRGSEPNSNVTSVCATGLDEANAGCVLQRERGCRGRGERGKAAQVIRRESRRACSTLTTTPTAGPAESPPPAAPPRGA